MTNQAQLHVKRRKDGPNPDKCSLYERLPDTPSDKQVISVMFQQFENDDLAKDFTISMAKSYAQGSSKETLQAMKTQKLDCMAKAKGLK